MELFNSMAGAVLTSSQLQLIVPIPHLEIGFQQLLAECNISLQEALFEIFNILTVEGTETSYYDLFDRYLASAKIPSNDPRYGGIYRQANEHYIKILDQINQMQYTPLIMVGCIVSFVLIPNGITLIIDYAKDFDECN